MDVHNHIHCHRPTSLCCNQGFSNSVSIQAHNGLDISVNFKDKKMKNNEVLFLKSLPNK